MYCTKVQNCYDLVYTGSVMVQSCESLLPSKLCSGGGGGGRTTSLPPRHAGCPAPFSTVIIGVDLLVSVFIRSLFHAVHPRWKIEIAMLQLN